MTATKKIEVCKQKMQSSDFYIVVQPSSPVYVSNKIY